MREKITKIRKLYETAIEEENALQDIWETIPSTMHALQDVTIAKLHLATKEVETLKIVLNILEKDLTNS